MTPENALMLELGTAIWTQLKEASERFGFDYDGANFDVSAMPERGRPGLWRCRISHDAHPRLMRKSVGSTLYLREGGTMIGQATDWARAIADDHGRLHQRENAIEPHTRRPWNVPDWSMTAPEIMMSIMEWAGTSMIALHAGHHQEIVKRLQNSISIRDLAMDGDRYVADEIVVRDGTGGGRAFSLQADRTRTIMKITRGVGELPETVVQGLAGSLVREVVSHPAMQSAIKTRVMSARLEDDVLELTLTPCHAAIATAPEGVDMGWMRVET